MYNIKKVIILGGGTSGNMTASALIKSFPDLDITVVESKNIKTIGVGESTTGTFNSYLELLELEDHEWMPYCNATYKSTIDFTNWDGQGTRVHYPFGGNSSKRYKYYDWFLKKSMYPKTPRTEFPKVFMNTIEMIDSNKLTFNKHNELEGFSFKNHLAYQFDAGLFGNFVKEKYAIPRGVKYVFDDIIDHSKSKRGYMTKLIGKKSTYEADLFIDCTGFKSMLLEKAMGVNFNSYKDTLLSDKAIATKLPYSDKNKEMETATNATTLSSGWVWNIPLWNRIGTGYVYSSKFQTPKEAEDEFREFLRNHRDVPKGDLVDELEFTHLDIKAGVHDVSMVKNVVAVGLSNGFIEPLESTGLILTYETIKKLLQLFNSRVDREGIVFNKFDVDIFNKDNKSLMDGFKEFITLHYALSERDDTPYWKFITEELEFDSNSGFYNRKHMANIGGGTAFIVAGFRGALFNEFKQIASKDQGAKLFINKMSKATRDKSEQNQEEVDKMLTHYEFLSKHIYNKE